MADELKSYQKVFNGRSIDTDGSSRAFPFGDFAADDGDFDTEDSLLPIPDDVPAADIFAGCGAFPHRISWHCGGM